jgi:hypothetical protein
MVPARDLTSSIEGRVTAPRLASLLLAKCRLREHYPHAVGDNLAEVDASVDRRCDEWLDDCSEVAGGLDLTAEVAFFSLVLLDEDFATWFRLTRPNHAGFDDVCERFVNSLGYRQTQAWDRFTATAPTATDRSMNPVMARAIDKEVAGFALVAQAWFASRREENTATGRATYARFYEPVRAAFEADNGDVITEYWCENIPAAMVRTKGKRQLHLITNDFPKEAESISDHADELFQSIVEYLEGREGEVLAQDTWSILTRLYADLDRAAGERIPPTLDEDTIAQHERSLDDTSHQVQARIERRAQRFYVLGTFIGAVVLGGVLAGISALATDSQTLLLLEGAVFGAAGAFISVVVRLGRGSLKLDPRQERLLLWTAALLRPLTGAVFGAITTAVLLSSILPIEVPTSELQRFYYLGTFAFIAGFAERWAPSLLHLVGQQVTGDDDADKKEPAPAD